MSKCSFGQYLQRNYSCKNCEIDTYSFEIDFNTFTLCNTCESITPFNCYGADKLTPKKGYWYLFIFKKFIEIIYFSLGDFLISQIDFWNAEMKIVAQVFSFYFQKIKKNFLNKGDQTNPPVFYMMNSAAICETGYTGVLCNECEENWGKINDNVCTSCNNPVYYLSVSFKIIIGIISTVIYFSFTSNYIFFLDIFLTYFN